MPTLAGKGRIELEETPFFPQEELQCGPAALATALGAAGVPADPAELVPEVFTPGLEGSLQPEMLGAVRRRGLLPYEISGDLDALAGQLVDGRPVLILQNLGLASYPVWHYAVVVGLDPAMNTLVLRSGRERRLIMSAGKFHKSWERAGRWGFVVIRPGQLPADIDAAAYAKAVAGLETAGRFEDAALAWEAGLVGSPDEAVYLFGLGNARYALGDKAGARASWERFVRLRPNDPAGLNNLAVVLGESGCVQRARSLAQQALAGLPTGDPVAEEIAQTLETLRARPAQPEPTGCQAPQP
ncbi:MAG: PA2778 family cysteine peptidase [Gammaproteobacteria bacterium]